MANRQNHKLKHKTHEKKAVFVLLSRRIGTGRDDFTDKKMERIKPQNAKTPRRKDAEVSEWGGRCDLKTRTENRDGCGRRKLKLDKSLRLCNFAASLRQVFRVSWFNKAVFQV
jgi:hypothetical protein